VMQFCCRLQHFLLVLRREMATLGIRRVALGQ
jgi:hypothetical protein